MEAVPTVTLNNGVEIPQLGFGVFQIPPDETASAVTAALEVGYRHIDTAERYHNEAGVGAAIRASGLDTSELFITSKLNNTAHSVPDARAAFDGTLEALGLERVDLFLIHWPLAATRDFTHAWRALEQVYAEGRARAIGVSNFHAHHIERLITETDVVPAVNQIEMHPYFNQQPLLDFDEAHGIATEAWSPIARGEVLGDPVLVAIGAAHSKTAAQVTLRWHIQRGSVVFPKTTSPARMAENFAIFDFTLSDNEMAAISALERGTRVGPDPDEFNLVA